MLIMLTGVSSMQPFIFCQALRFPFHPASVAGMVLHDISSRGAGKTVEIAKMVYFPALAEPRAGTHIIDCNLLLHPLSPMCC